MSRIEEPAQSLVLQRVELSQIECPFLAWENPADEHDLDHVDEPELIAHQLLDAASESRQLLRIAPQQALLFPGGELHGDARSKLGGRRPCGLARLGDVEPPRLPPLDGVHEGPFEPKDEHMEAYLAEVRKMEKYFSGLKL